VEPFTKLRFEGHPGALIRIDRNPEHYKKTLDFLGKNSSENKPIS